MKVTTQKLYTITPVVYIDPTVGSLPLHQQVQLKVAITVELARLPKQDQVRVAHEVCRLWPGFRDV